MIRRASRWLALCSLALPLVASAAPKSVPSPQWRAIVGGRVVVAPGRVLERATVLMKDGVIAEVGTDVALPPGTIVRDAAGMVVHAAFLDPHLALSRLNGVAKDAKDAGPRPSATGSTQARVHPEVRVADWLAPDAKALEALRAQGFASACVVPDQGILRGRDAVVSLGGGDAGARVIAESGDLHAAFDAGPPDSDEYPNSVMGATAVLRQALLDADWYRRARRAAAGSTRVAADASLQALGDAVPARSGAAPASRLVFACKDVLDVLRAGRLAEESGARLRLRCAGDEYRRLADVVALKAPLVVPVAFPAPPQVADESEWDDVSDEQLRAWRHAPDNPRWLRDAGASVSLTTDGLEDVADFGDRVRRCIARGLSPDDALAMVTTEPARQLGLSLRLGTLERGREAQVVVATGEPFREGAEIREVWVDGVRHVVARPPAGPAGSWKVTVTWGAVTFPAKLVLGPQDASLSWEKGSGPGADGGDDDRKAAITEVRVDDERARFRIAGGPFGREGEFEASAAVGEGRIGGSAPALGLAFSGERAPKDAPKKAEPQAPLKPPPVRGGPLTKRPDVLFRGATAWTCAQEGILEDTDVLVRDGRIAAIGRGLHAPEGVPVVEMSGRHLTPGLIDAHNHSAIVGGVNEGTRSCTAEVRIGDVVNSETLDIYRQLAGGLTAANLLHGSANCMGGQSQVIRLKWGAGPEELKFRESFPMIKFALGENVKQSNWGEKYVTRFPQTRMGVEQFMRLKFQEARDYAEAARARPGRGELPPRRDLQLECLDEILDGVRKVHCHSYRQDEILMLIRVAEEFGFRVGTFQHVLEGYKVADEIAAHGAGASCFTDWWAYKFEVYDAIPHNAALMWRRGVLVTVNSDSTELARRMQLEAAKAVKWGGVPRDEALKLVTLNAAMQLGVDSVVGSLAVGKQADLATWSGDPLSPSSRCESTWIQGLKYFDRQADLASRAQAQREREALIDLARKAQQDGEKGAAWKPPSYLLADHGCRDEEVTP